MNSIPATLNLQETPSLPTWLILHLPTQQHAHSIHILSVEKQRGDREKRPVQNVAHVLLMREEHNNAVDINNVKQAQLFTQLAERDGQQL